MKKILFYVTLVLSLLVPVILFASATDGTIDPVNNRAHFTTTNGGGYINFAATQGNVHVTDAGLTGSAWSEQYGWIKMNPTNGGVTNDAEGHLSGYAWGEHVGWVNFRPTNGGVDIGSNGIFSGYAWSENQGWISFNCATEGVCGSSDYKVGTDWRPASTRGTGPDSCPNIAGIQTEVPGGYVLDINGSCVPAGNGGPPPPPGTDLCSNIVGIQEAVPLGMLRDSNNNCFASGDVCPNISGVQTSIPQGLVINNFGSCVVPEECLLLPDELKQSLDVMLIVDLSGSMDDKISGNITKLTQAKAAAQAFIDHLDPDTDRVGLATFGNTGRVDVGLTSTFGPVKTKIGTLKTNGGTNIGDGIKAANSELVAHGRQNVKHIIILLTDGYVTLPGNNPANYAINQANNAKGEAEVIYTIGLGKSVDANFLKNIATLPSYFYHSPTGDDLTNIYIEISKIECTARTSSVSGKVIHDLNINGIFDNAEPGIPNAQLQLVSPTYLPVRYTATITDGSFSFTNVAAGNYLACAVQMPGYVQTYPTTNNGCFNLFIIQGYSANELIFAEATGLPLPPGDVCVNLAGVQTTIPQGLVSDGQGNCIPPQPPPTDACPNIAGLQDGVPAGLILDEAGNCIIPIEPIDVCLNMDGIQSALPVGMMFDGPSNCVPIPNADLCANIPGVQTTVPQGMLIDSSHNCVPLENDVCPNLAGVQSDVPTGMQLNASGDCVPLDPNQDLCLNISGIQRTIPSGMQVDADGNCTLIPLTTDVCPNIPGNQASIPSGMQYNAQGQCVTPTPAACVGPLCLPSLPGLPDLPSILRDPAGRLASTTKAIQEALASLYKDPRVSALSRTISGLGIVGMTAMFFIPLSWLELFLLPLRLWGLLLSLLGLKKKQRSWGIVYDSVTKQPLDPAYVSLLNAQGNTIATTITDIDGRYGFLTSPGTYYLNAQKSNYVFPSQKLAGQASDVLYNNLCFGGPITISEDSTVIDKNIPMDALNFDWNEFSKKSLALTRFYSARDKIFLKITDWFFRLGFVLAVIALIAAPQPYNFIIFAIYVILVILRRFGIKGRTYGALYNAATGNPLPFAIVRIISPAINREIAHKVADQHGRYYCLVPRGKYIVRIDRKNLDQSYSTIAEIPVDAPKGIINKSFRI